MTMMISADSSRSKRNLTGAHVREQGVPWGRGNPSMPSSSYRQFQPRRNRPAAGTPRRPGQTPRRAPPWEPAHCTRNPLRRQELETRRGIQTRTLGRSEALVGRGSLTVDVVEAEGDGEREPIGVAAVAAAGPDLLHLRASERK